VGAVRFPSGVSLDSGNAGSNMCLNCHQGRQSGVGVEAAITRAGVGDDTVTEALSFMNPHYAPAGGTLYGTEVQGAYEYAGNAYNGHFTHVQMANTCVQCHDTHSLEVKVNTCSTCHSQVSSAEDLQLIRFSEIDFDGDGDVSEGLAGEIASMKAFLLEAIMDYAMDNTDADAIVYSSARHPYFFIDSNENRVADADEVNSANRYVTWTPRLLRAAYNYQWVSKDPGAYAHNPMYTMQILYDSLQDIGADVSGMTRPEVPQE
ncbi:MAG: polyheme membrane-associated cytochrome C, partial [Anaerolineales bacterium]